MLFNNDVKKLKKDFAVNAWLEGVPAEKLVLGLATYGRSFQLKEGFESCPTTGVPVNLAGNSGKFTREAGFLCNLLLTLLKIKVT